MLSGKGIFLEVKLLFGEGTRRQGEVIIRLFLATRIVKENIGKKIGRK